MGVSMDVKTYWFQLQFALLAAPATRHDPLSCGKRALTAAAVRTPAENAKSGCQKERSVPMLHARISAAPAMGVPRQRRALALGRNPVVANRNHSQARESGGKIPFPVAGRQQESMVASDPSDVGRASVG